MTEIHIGVMPGDGIGPQIMESSLPLVERAAEIVGAQAIPHHISIGTESYEQTGEHLPASSLDKIKLMDASLKGPVGGPPNSRNPRYADIEKEAVIRFRKELGLDTSIRWIDTSLSRIIPELSPLKPELVQDTDLVVIRDLAGDVYNGKSGIKLGRQGRAIFRTFFEMNSYSQSQVDRTVDVGIEEARRRGDRHITLVHKTNVLKKTGGLWKERFDEKLAEDGGEFDADYMHVDNAVQAIMGDSDQFDVIVTPNLFGDIISDLTAKIMGSIGMGGGAEVGPDNQVYGPVHGSSPNLAYGMANPTGMLLSAARMYDDLGLPEAGALIRESIGKVLDSGNMTLDLWVKAKEVRDRSFTPRWASTSAFATLVRREMEQAA